MSRITGVTGTPVPSTGVSKKKSSSKTQSSGIGSEDSVTLTSTAESLGDMSQIFSAIPIVDGQKVDDIRESLAHGLYEIDSYQVATKFIELEVMLNEAERRNNSG